MKMTKLTYLLALVLVATMAVTGCRNHQPVRVTSIKGPPSTGQVGDISGGGTVGGGDKVGGGDTANIHPGEDNEDRAALAAYTVHFAYDSSAVRKSERSSIDAVAAALKSDGSARLLIEGNCDERGTEEYNRSLGERRALALRQALGKAGIDPMRIRTISYGKDKPVDPDHNDAAWAKNRRGDFVLLHPKAGA